MQMYSSAVEVDSSEQASAQTVGEDPVPSLTPLCMCTSTAPDRMCWCSYVCAFIGMKLKIFFAPMQT